MTATRPHLLALGAILSAVAASISAGGAVPGGGRSAPSRPRSTGRTAGGRRGGRPAGFGAGPSLAGPTRGVFAVSSIFDASGRRLARGGGDQPGGSMDWTVEAVAADGTGGSERRRRDRNDGISRRNAAASETVGTEDLPPATIIVISHGSSTATPTAAPTTVAPTEELTLSPTTSSPTTDEPTAAPVTDAPTTDAPTPCVSSEAWHYASGVCTNAPLTPGEIGTDGWSTLNACCYVSTGAAACEYVDVCSPDYIVPNTPSPVVSVATGVPTRRPSRCDPTNDGGDPCTESPVTKFTYSREPTPEPTGGNSFLGTPPLFEYSTAEPTAEAPIAPNGEPFSNPTQLPTGGSWGVGTPPEFIFSTPVPTPCGHPFYIVMAPGPPAGEVCKNEPLGDYRGVTVYETVEECCSAGFKTGQCLVDDYCGLMPPCGTGPPEMINVACPQPTPVTIVRTRPPTEYPSVGYTLSPTAGLKKSELKPTPREPCVPAWGSGVSPLSEATGKSGKTKGGAGPFVSAFSKSGKTKGGANPEGDDPKASTLGKSGKTRGGKPSSTSVTGSGVSAGWAAPDTAPAASFGSSSGKSGKTKGGNVRSRDYYGVGYSPGLYTRSYRSNVWGAPKDVKPKAEPCKPTAASVDPFEGKSGKTKAGADSLVGKSGKTKAGDLQFRLFGSAKSSKTQLNNDGGGLAAPSMDGWNTPPPPPIQEEWSGPQPHGQGWTDITHGKDTGDMEFWPEEEVEVSIQPVLNDDEAQTQMNVAVTIPVLANDPFIPPKPRGQLIQPSSGSARYHETKIIYTPEGGFCGTDKFTYTILDFDKEYSDSAEVTVEVKCPEAAVSQGCPRVSDDFAVTYTNESVVVPVMDNDEFVPGDGRGSIKQPTHGTVRMGGNQILYVPKSDFCGFDEFTYTIYSADDSCSSPATVGVDVRCETEPELGIITDSPTNKPTPEPEQGSITDSPSKKPTPEPTVFEVIPVANNDYAVVDQGRSVIIFVLANDVIPKDAAGRFGVPDNGTIEKGAAELVYTPNADFCGVDIFEYTLFNDKHSSTATVTVEVTCDETTTTVATTSTSVATATTTTSTDEEEDAGDAQTTNPPEDTFQANDDFANGVEDTPLLIPVLANDIIPDGASGAFGTPLHGSILDVTESGLIYMPADGYCGPDEFVYEVYFGGRTESAEVKVEIACVGAEFVDEYSSPAPSVISKPAPIRPSESTTTETLPVEDIVDQGPPDDIEEDVGDAPTINPQNDTFEVNDVFANGVQDTPLSIPVLANDIIPDGASGAFEKPLHGTILEFTENGLIYMPADGYCGKDVFVYEVYFGDRTESAEVKIEIACIAAALPIEEIVDQGPPDDIVDGKEEEKPDPSAVNDDAVVTMNSGVNMINVLANDVDPSGYELFVEAISYDASHGVCEVPNEGEAIVYVPNADFTGSDMCIYSACNADGNCDTAVVAITVEAESEVAPEDTGSSAGIVVEIATTVPPLPPIFPVSPEPPVFPVEPPVAENINVGTTQGTAVTIDLGNLFDLDMTEVRIAYASSNGKLAQDEDRLVYKPDRDFVGVEEIEYTVCTLGGAVVCDTSVISITVSEIPRAVSAENDQGLTLQDSAAYFSVLKNDIGEGTLEVDSILTAASHGICEVADAGTTVKYTPEDGYVGEDRCVYLACCDCGECDSAVLAINVDSFDLAPDGIQTQDNGNVGYSPYPSRDGVEIESQPLTTETPRQWNYANSIVTVVVAAVCAVAAVGTVFRFRRNKSIMRSLSAASEEAFPDEPLFMSPYSPKRDGNSLTGDLKSQIERQLNLSSENISVSAFLTGEATSPPTTNAKRSLFSRLSPTRVPDVTPLSPTGSLFTVRSSTSSSSKKTYIVEDTVDL